jgi:hypothetical protein
MIKMIKSRMMTLAGHVVHRRVRRGMHTGFGWERQKKLDHWEDLIIFWWIILK